ncbi:dephospho-CoA kinase [Euhalothece natronophila Z-M001]|uniref:Dephospho-CoA kinase n=1 Tax=Euhalothece natronophila Z-M001 TaxID=522448 RepID=A0A5B8NNQ1_9CHRO|nr:dephospho-CoA kinase [Euhalothece natronophila]QDZ40694.1 dephospho-CoA kinase [Euhalothece natronophila Z-M001]
MSQRIIGLTGGIGTGKSAIAHYLENLYNIPILDADYYAREAVREDSPILERIKNRYGNEVINIDDSLNRSRLGEIIFNNATEKQWLEEQIHPYVRHQIETALSASNAKIIVAMIPLLFEVKMQDLVTETWVVYCPEEEQLKRIMERDGLSEKEARSRINAQMSLSDKIALADVVIDNSGSLLHLQKQLHQLLA